MMDPFARAEELLNPLGMTWGVCRDRSAECEVYRATIYIRRGWRWDRLVRVKGAKPGEALDRAVDRAMARHCAGPAKGHAAKDGMGGFGREATSTSGDHWRASCGARP